MIRGSNGLDYEDLTARLLDEPSDTYRNTVVQGLRKAGVSEAAIRSIVAEGEARGDFYVPYSAPYPDQGQDDTLAGFAQASHHFTELMLAGIRTHLARLDPHCGGPEGAGSTPPGQT